MLLRLFPQSSLDHFHVHREPSQLVNPSVVQNDTSCRPSPCGWLSQPRTTTAAPPPVRLIGENLNRQLSAWLRDHPTRTGFPGSPVGTQTSTFRLRCMDTRQRTAAPSDIRGVAGCSTKLLRSPIIWAVAAVAASNRLSHSLVQVTTPRRPQCSRE